MSVVIQQYKNSTKTGAIFGAFLKRKNTLLFLQLISALFVPRFSLRESAKKLNNVCGSVFRGWLSWSTFSARNKLENAFNNRQTRKKTRWTVADCVGRFFSRKSSWQLRFSDFFFCHFLQNFQVQHPFERFQNLGALIRKLRLPFLAVSDLFSTPKNWWLLLFLFSTSVFCFSFLQIAFLENY